MPVRRPPPIATATCDNHELLSVRPSDHFTFTSITAYFSFWQLRSRTILVMQAPTVHVRPLFQLVLLIALSCYPLFPTIPRPLAPDFLRSFSDLFTLPYTSFVQHTGIYSTATTTTTTHHYYDSRRLSTAMTVMLPLQGSTRLVNRVAAHERPVSRLGHRQSPPRNTGRPPVQGRFSIANKLTLDTTGPRQPASPAKPTRRRKEPCLLKLPALQRSIVDAATRQPDRALAAPFLRTRGQVFGQAFRRA